MIETIVYSEKASEAIIEISNLKNDGCLINMAPLTPIINDQNELIVLIEADQSTIDLFENLHVLGLLDDVFNDPQKKVIYDRIYEREYRYVDENGIKQTGLKPERFGGFAK